MRAVPLDRNERSLASAFSVGNQAAERVAGIDARRALCRTLYEQRRIMISHPKFHRAIQRPPELLAIPLQFGRYDPHPAFFYAQDVRFQSIPEGRTEYSDSSTTVRPFRSHREGVRLLGNSFLLQQGESHAAGGHSEHLQTYESRLAKSESQSGYQVLLSCRQYNIDLPRI